MPLAYRSGSVVTAGNASGGDLTLPLPTGTVDGDIVVVLAYFEPDTTTISISPGTWESVTVANTGLFRLTMFVKRASSEPTSYTISNSTAGDQWRSAVGVAYSGGTGTGTIIDVSGTNQGDAALATAQTAPSVTTSGANRMVVFGYGNYSGTNVTSTTGFCTNLRGSHGGTTIADALLASAGSTGTSRPSGGVGTEDFAAMHVALVSDTGGGTTYTASLAGTLAGGGALVRQPGRGLGGTLASAGTLVRQAQRLGSGTLASAGTLARRPARLLAGSLASGGTLATARVLLLSVAGTLASSGNLSRQARRLLAGTLASAGGLVRQPGRLLAGTLTSSGTLAMIRTRLLAVGGTLTSAGALLRRPVRSLSGTLASTGTLVRQPARVLSGTLTSAGTLGTLRSRLLAVGGTLASSGTLVRKPGRLLAGTLASSGTLARQARLGLGGTLTSAGGLTRQVGRALGGVLAALGALVPLRGTSGPRVATPTRVVVLSATEGRSAVLSMTESRVVVLSPTRGMSEVV